MKGTYLLILQLDQPLVGLTVGRLGTFPCPSGYYLYVGSAYGPGGLAARLARHKRLNTSRPHWHIDYLRPHARLVETWAVGGAQLEQAWAFALAATPGVQLPIPGFGASDSTAPSHLFWFAKRPGSQLLTTTLLQAVHGANDTLSDLVIEINTYEKQHEA